jgi:signal transduction histidine kinase
LEPAISSIIEEVNNLNKLLVEFREFTRLPNPHPENVNIRVLIEEVVEFYRTLSSQVSINYQLMEDEVNIKADRNQIKQVFANLLKNAMQAMPSGGEISIMTDLVKKNDNRYFRVQIRDTGEGIDESIREKIFDPYFSTKGEGSGLGLSIVDRIIFDHSGRIWFESKRGSGTTFFIDLPLES